jgi:hypothetical protein
MLRKTKGDSMSPRNVALHEARRLRSRVGQPRLAGLALCAWLGFSFPFSARSGSPTRSPGTHEDQDGAGAYFNAEASSKDVGLPIYPGARPHKDGGQDKPSAKFGLWGSSFAFKLAVVKLETNDSPEKVAAFYKRALAKYGPVLDCRNASAGQDEKGDPSKQLDCGSDKPAPGHMTFKSGTKQKQHVFGIEPDGKGSIIQLVYVESPD